MKQRRVINVTVSCLAVAPEGSKVNSKSVAVTEILPTQSLKSKGLITNHLENTRNTFKMFPGSGLKSKLILNNYGRKFSAI